MEIKLQRRSPVRRMARLLLRELPAAISDYIAGSVLLVFTNVSWKITAETLRRKGILGTSAPSNHGLDRPLIVSFTSYRKRFTTIAPTIKRLLSQSVRPDELILWLGVQDEAYLTDELKAFVRDGLRIRFTPDIRSYTKIIPTLIAYPGAIVVTADDDVFYRRNWLKDLVDGHKMHPRDVICHRAHKIALSSDGMVKPYGSWHYEYPKPEASAHLFATGVGGVLYPPGSLHADVTDQSTFLDLCPTADDVWLYWMARRNGTIVRKIGSMTRITSWPGSQTMALHKGNVAVGAGNDVQMARLAVRYGLPVAQ